MWWFLKNSYLYVNPRGIKGHLKFLKDLPRASWVYYKLSKE